MATNGHWEKAYPQEYEGSLAGTSALHFALWDYCWKRRDRTGIVSVCPTIAAAIFNEPVERIESVLDCFQQPDPKSRQQAEAIELCPDEFKDACRQGIRLVKLDTYNYFVVKHTFYLSRSDFSPDEIRNRKRDWDRAHADTRHKSFQYRGLQDQPDINPTDPTHNPTNPTTKTKTKTKEKEKEKESHSDLVARSAERVWENNPRKPEAEGKALLPSPRALPPTPKGPNEPENACIGQEGPQRAPGLIQGAPPQNGIDDGISSSQCPSNYFGGKPEDMSAILMRLRRDLSPKTAESVKAIDGAVVWLLGRTHDIQQQGVDAAKWAIEHADNPPAAFLAKCKALGYTPYSHIHPSDHRTNTNATGLGSVVRDVVRDAH